MAYKNPFDAANNILKPLRIAEPSNPNVQAANLTDAYQLAYDDYAKLHKSEKYGPSVTNWVNAYNKGAFSNPDRKNQITAGWYDWFAKDSALAGKTKKMGDIIKQIRPGGKINLDDNYVWFKNNFPLHGNLYDDFRFASRDDGEVQLTTQIGNPWNKKYAVFGRRNKGGEFSQEPLFESDSLKELIKWYNSPWGNLLGSKSRFASKYPDRFANLQKGYNKDIYGGRDIEEVDWDEIARLMGIEL